MRIFLLPFSILYWGIITFRNLLYNNGWLRSFQFDFPVICIGNLSTGGTGKTPHTEFLIQTLREKYPVATLSRGYRRRLKGYALATDLSLVEDIGDEAKQFKQKFPEIEVCVCENRVEGVYRLLQDAPDVKVILMDDGLQHRRIDPGLKIMLTSFHHLFYKDRILPAGNLREPRSAYKRMQVVIVTKCPQHFTEEQKKNITGEINLQLGQNIFFTSEVFDELKPLFAEQTLQAPQARNECMFVSGIADNSTALLHLKETYEKTDAMRFSDHYYFSEDDILNMKLRSVNKILVTTEKDAMRLMEHKEFILQNDISIFVLPLRIRFLFNDAEVFNRLIESYVQSVMPV